jgi:peptidoglycan-N-acetylglucosamine deacetylase
VETLAFRFRRHFKDIFMNALPEAYMLRRGPADKKQVALTFDDGPDEMTLEYLDLLDKLEMKATFFLIGARAEAHPDLVREYLKRGHQVAAHGYGHIRFPLLDWKELKTEVAKTADHLGARRTQKTWVRPPFGKLSMRVVGTLIAQNYTMAMWSYDSHDFEIEDVDELVKKCGPDVLRPGEVVLMHEGQRWTLDSLPRIVENLRGAGFELVTMAEMFPDC